MTALWMALQCPSADVRCITFGSPKAGNAAFTEVFRQAFQVACLAQSAGFLQLLLNASLQSSHLQHMKSGGVHLRQLQHAAAVIHLGMLPRCPAACQSSDLHGSGGHSLKDTC